MLAVCISVTIMTDLPEPTLVERSRRWWRVHRVSLRWADWHPRVGAVIAIAAFGFQTRLKAHQLDAVLTDVLPVAITVAAVLAGFQATAHSVLIAVIDTPAWKFLQAARHDVRVIEYHAETMNALFAFIGVAVVVMIVEATVGFTGTTADVGLAVLAGLFIWSALCCVRLSRCMVKLLKKRDGQDGGHP